MKVVVYNGKVLSYNGKVVVFTPPASAPDDPPPSPGEIVAAFSVVNAEIGEPVRIVNSSTGATSYLIEWGDGATSNDINAVHRYRKSSTFSITLTAISNTGSTSVAHPVIISDDLLPWEGAALLTRIDRIAQSNNSVITQIPDLSGKSRNLSSSGGWTFQTGVKNGKPVIRGGGSANVPFTNNAAFTIRCGWIVAKNNGATFDDFRGLLSDLTTSGILVGDNGTTEFFDFGYDLYEFRSNDRIYPAANAPAPMGEFKIYFFRFWKNLAVSGVSLGQDRATTARRWKGDIALLGLYSRDFDEDEIKKYSQKLASFYALTLANIYPYQGAKSDDVTYAMETNYYDPPEGERISEVLSGLKRSFDLTFPSPCNDELKFFRDFFAAHYPQGSFVYRDLSVTPPEDIEGYFDSAFKLSGGQKDISVTFKEK